MAKVLTSSLLALGIITGVGVTAVYRQLSGNIGFDDISAQLGDDRPEVTGPRGAINILVMGSDSREGVGNDIDSEGGGGSDTTILMHLNADRKSAYGISIPRDSLVDRPECYLENGETTPAADDVLWNQAFNVGGPACTQRQFEQLTGIRVDNYVVVDFSGFKNMVDAVGGVDICVPEDIDDSKSGLKLEAGNQTVSGDDALGYVRLRAVGNGSDLSRIKRQQAFIAAMANKVVSGGVLANPVRVISFLDAATKSLQTDFESLKDIAGVGNQFSGVGLKRIQFITVPVIDAPEDPNRVVWTEDSGELWTKVMNDAPLGKLREGAITAADGPGSGPSASSSPSDDASPSDEPSDDPDGTDQPSESPSPTTGLGADERESVGLCS